MKGVSNLIVIAGGSSNGKTAILNELSSRGYITFPEVARVFLEERRKELSDKEYLFPSKKETEYRQREIYSRQFKLEESLAKKEGVYFIERSLVDVLVFSKYFLGAEFFQGEDFKQRTYSKVFIPENLDFTKGKIRVEKDIHEAKKINELIITAYSDLGYCPDIVPNFRGTRQEQIKRRTDYILTKLREKF